MAKDFETAEVILLISFCRELQRYAGDQPFELSSHKAADLLNTYPKKVNRWLKGLIPLEILAMAKQGDWTKKEANLWWYLPPLDE